MKNHSPITICKSNEGGIMYIRTFGKFEIISSKGLIEDKDWKSQKALSLFRYLVTNRNKKIPVEVIYSFFWENMDENYARINLNSALHTIRKITGLTSQDLYLKRNVCCLLIDNENIKVDADDFKKFIDLSKKASSIAEAIIYLKKAKNIYKGPFLIEEFYTNWSQDERTKYEMMYIEILDQLIELFYKEKNYHECLDCLYKYLNVEPYNERNYYKAISILISIGRIKEGKNLYNKMKRFLREINLDPIKKFENLIHECKTIKRGQRFHEDSDLQIGKQVDGIKKREEGKSIVLKILFKDKKINIKNILKKITKFLRKGDEIFCDSYTMYLHFSNSKEEDKIFLKRKILSLLDKMGVNRDSIEFK